MAYFKSESESPKALAECSETQHSTKEKEDIGIHPLTPRSLKGTSYVEKYTAKDPIEEIFPKQTSNAFATGGDVNELSSVGTYPDIDELDREIFTKVYEDYYKNRLKKPSKLIINDYKSKILSIIESNEVSIISGHTGCGKTTQVPQFILDECAKNNAPCNIIVAQPRRIGAITLARRICEERDWAFGSLCGYKVGLKNLTSEDTRLTFVTIGLFLQILLNCKHLNDYTHIILDEVHERNQELDFCLIIIKTLLSRKSKNVKVILMSATAEVEKLSEYFQRVIGKRTIPVPIVHIEQLNKFLVQIHYLDELSSFDLPEINYEEPRISDSILNVSINLIKAFDKIDDDPQNKKSVLVFLPGIYEIQNLYDKLRNPKFYNDGNLEYKWFAVPLHSAITFEEQTFAFHPAPTGFRKIILATNVAESSITVPDVMFVIDFCLTKVQVTDPSSNIPSLQLKWASKANCIQRAGRVGRVMEGRVYRMIHTNFFETLSDTSTPDILRAPLDKVVLQSKLLDMGPPEAVLSLALDPPDLTNIERTILTLKEAGGLLLTSKGKLCSNDGDLTYLGRIMTLMPVDIHITRMIILGYVYSCLNECIIIGAALTLKSIFSSPFREKLRSYNSKLIWADGSCCDCIAFLNVYNVWRENHNNGYFKRSVGFGESDWAVRHFIQLRALKEVQILVEEIRKRLKSYNIEELGGMGRVMWDDLQKPFVLKFVIAGAFYPNYFTRGARGGQVDENSAVKTLCGRDPFKTVYLQNYPLDQPHELYSHLIKENLSLCKEDMKISYDSSNKVYIEFVKQNFKEVESECPFSSEVPGKISTAIYRAVKIRQILGHIEIKVLEPKKAMAMAKSLGLYKPKSYVWESTESPQKQEIHKYVLPGTDVNYLSLKITHIDNPGHFWAMHKDGINEKFEKEIFSMLNLEKADFETYSKIPEVGDMCAAPYQEENETWLYRARIDAIKETNKKFFAQVFFIDYGNSELVPITQLKKYGPNLLKKVEALPGRAFECVLANIRPSFVKDPNGKWCKEAQKKFCSMVQNGEIICHVYSVVGGVVSCVLYKMLNLAANSKQININEMLVKEGFAEEAEESVLSKANNAMRCQTLIDSVQKKALDSKGMKDDVEFPAVKMPDLENANRTITLKGPYSPLEMKIFSCVRGGNFKHVSVSPNSVNSVLLDSDPQDPHERLIVAAQVNQSQSGHHFIINNTTIMPNIHGLSALIPFVFAPTVEIRVDSNHTKYTGILCGLGVDDNNEPIFPEHDMEFVFDCEFNLEDLSNINKLRFYMSLLLFSEGDNIEPVHSHSDTLLFQNEIKSALVSLIDKKRPSQDLMFPIKEYKWGLVHPDLVIDSLTAKQYDKSSIFPLHRGVSIAPKSNIGKDLIKKFDDLSLLIKKNIEPTKPVLCNLCDITMPNLQAVKYHLMAPSHKRKEEEFRKKYSD